LHPRPASPIAPLRARPPAVPGPHGAGLLSLPTRAAGSPLPGSVPGGVCDRRSRAPGAAAAERPGGGRVRRVAGTGGAASAAAGVDNRALAPLAGRPMVAWVLAALAAAQTVERIVLVGAEGLTDAPGVRQQLRGGGDLMETIERGMGACPGAAYVLLVTADI